MTALSRDIKKRLQAATSPVPFTSCLMYTGAGVPRGYGVIYRDGRQQYAHRVAWELVNGPIPEGMFVLHECDVPGCVNPKHLFLGTPKDNTQDMLAKGRHRAAPPSGDRNPMRLYPGLLAGEKHGCARLSAQEVETIRDLYSRGATQVSLSARFGVGQSHISRIIRRTSWA